MQHFILNGKMDRMQLKQKYRQGFTVAEKTEPWGCWRRGGSLKLIVSNKTS
jgi:hypothetical protein